MTMICKNGLEKDDTTSSLVCLASNNVLGWTDNQYFVVTLNQTSQQIPSIHSQLGFDSGVNFTFFSFLCIIYHCSVAFLSHTERYEFPFNMKKCLIFVLTNYNCCTIQLQSNRVNTTGKSAHIVTSQCSNVIICAYFCKAMVALPKTILMIRMSSQFGILQIFCYNFHPELIHPHY